jgi:hypothetical protein
MRVDTCRDGRANGLVNLSWSWEIREVLWAVVSDDKALDATRELIVVAELWEWGVAKGLAQDFAEVMLQDSSGWVGRMARDMQEDGLSG